MGRVGDDQLTGGTRCEANTRERRVDRVLLDDIADRYAVFPPHPNPLPRRGEGIIFLASHRGRGD